MAKTKLKPKAFIMASTSSQEFLDAYGVPKQLLQIDGEPLINRTVRLLKGAGYDVTISGSFKVVGAKNYKTESDSFESHVLDLVEHGANLILYGDCFYTEKFINFASEVQITDWCHFCRMDQNEETGKIWGEGYGFKLVDTDDFRYLAYEFLRKLKRNEVRNDNKWNFNRYLNRVQNIYVHDVRCPSPHDLLWQDETDDFDYVRDYPEFLWKTGRIDLHQLVAVKTGSAPSKWWKEWNV